MGTTKEPVRLDGGRTRPFRGIPLCGVIELPACADGLPTLDSILRGRKSRRTFRAMDLASLSNVVWLSLKRTRDSNGDESAPYPSFGGLGSVRCLLLNLPTAPDHAGIYDAEAHTIADYMDNAFPM